MHFSSHTRQSLNGSWLLALDFQDRGVSRIAHFEDEFIHRLDAVVPGNFELDLQRAGLIEEPYIGSNMTAPLRRRASLVWPHLPI